ncbi:MAG TPA: 3-hydroxyacyl-ACP dehydratase [Chitinophagaceae bacterium]
MGPEEDILSLIPQRPPFVMIDKLLYFNETITQTSFLITEKNIFVETGEFCEAGLMENIAQAAAARAGYIARLENKPVSGGYIGAVKNLEIMDLPKINDELITEIKLENQVFDIMLISGRVYCKDKLLATCEMKIFVGAVK